MRALASGGKYFSTYLLAQRLAEQLVGRLAQRFQRGFISFAPLEVRAVEARSSPRRTASDSDGGGRVEQVPLEVGLPVGERGRRRAAGRPPAGTSARCTFRSHAGHAARRRSTRPSRSAASASAARRRSSCGRWPRVAQRHVVERGLGERLLHARTRSRRPPSPRAAVKPASSNIFATCSRYFVARLHEARLGLEVVVAVGQARGRRRRRRAITSVGLVVVGRGRDAERARRSPGRGGGRSSPARPPRP